MALEDFSRNVAFVPEYAACTRAHTHTHAHTLARTQAHNLTSKPSAVQEVEGGSDTRAKQHVYVAPPPLCYDFMN